MAVFVVVGSAAAFGIDLQHEIEVRGHAAVIVPDWSTAVDEVARGSCAAVVFLADEPDHCLSGWRHGLISCRDLQRDLVAVALASSRGRPAEPDPMHVVLPLADVRAEDLARSLVEVVYRADQTRWLTERFNALHQKVLTGDSGAAEDLCQLMVTELRRQVRAAMPGTEFDEIDSAIDSALVKYVRRPQLYDPARGRPGALFVAMVKRLVIDQRRREARHRAREVQVPATLDRLAPPRAPAGQGTVRPDRLEGRDFARQALAVTRSPRERAFMKAYLAGAPLKAQASALGVADLPEPDRKAEMARVRRLIVKRLKYRLARRRRR